ncbi:DUF1800 domain-containing protein [Polaromonas sp. P1-6]|nr:DUF1800 domain-containing protein [Polaromonas sp. P1-6]
MASTPSRTSRTRRAFTGWSVERDDFSFKFRPAFHDAGSKTLLGRSGNFDGDAALDIMLEQPAARALLSANSGRSSSRPYPMKPMKPIKPSLSALPSAFAKAVTTSARPCAICC